MFQFQQSEQAAIVGCPMGKNIHLMESVWFDYL
jgi:hypothetical protein